MKKRITIIIGIVVLSICAMVGVVYANNTRISKEQFENLSEEDKAVKTELAKYSDTTIDFRKNMQEEISSRKHDIHFVEVNEYNTKKVIYKNDLDDEFEYNIETGKLCEAVINSNVVEKTDDSIDIDKAYKIAMKLLSKEVNIDEYTQYAYRETSKGYFFWYNRYIGKYRTTDSFSATIGFDGSVVDLSDSTDMFNGKDIDFSEKYITKKIYDYFKDSADVNINYDDTTILIHEGNVCANVSVEIVTEDLVNSYVEIVPLE